MLHKYTLRPPLHNMAGTNGLTRANELLAITDSLRLSSQVGSLVQEHEEKTVFSTTPNHRVEHSIELNTKICPWKQHNISICL